MQDPTDAPTRQRRAVFSACHRLRDRSAGPMVESAIAQTTERPGQEHADDNRGIGERRQDQALRIAEGRPARLTQRVEGQAASHDPGGEAAKKTTHPAPAVHRRIAQLRRVRRGPASADRDRSARCRSASSNESRRPAADQRNERPEAAFRSTNTATARPHQATTVPGRRTSTTVPVPCLRSGRRLAGQHGKNQALTSTGARSQQHRRQQDHDQDGDQQLGQADLDQHRARRDDE